MDSSSALVILKVFILYLPTAAKTFHILVGISRCGDIDDAARLPRCSTGERIMLLSYGYLHTSSPDFAREQSLSPAAELIIHEMCSLKQSCDRHRFPAADLPEQETTMLEIKYQCLGNFDNFVDICDRRQRIVDGTTHLMITDTALSHRTCECFVNGEFTITLVDVRLKSAQLNKCSNARLRVQADVYSCNSAKDNFGSVFRRRLGNQLMSAYIRYSADSRNMRPEMVYFTISATGIAEIWCEGVLRYSASRTINSTTSSITKSTTQILKTENYVDMKGKRSYFSDREIAVPVWAMAVTLSGLGGLLIISTGVTLYYRRKLVKSSRFDRVTHANYLTCTGTAETPETPETETRMHEMIAQAPSMCMATSSPMSLR